MRIGVLTGGGDAPGLNSIIRAIVIKAASNNDEVVGIQYGWKGLIDNVKPINLTVDKVRDVFNVGGTLLKSSRTNPFKLDNGINIVEKNIKKHKIDALIAIGGDDTLGVAHKLAKDGVKIVGVPKTMDNDLSETDWMVGFDTAVNTAMDSIERIHTTAKSHDRTIIVEVYGRDAGWVALFGGLAGGAHYICIPEVEFSVEDICKHVKERYKKGNKYCVIVVAEGAVPKERDEQSSIGNKLDEFGHVKLGGIAEWMAKVVEKKTGAETRHLVLAHLVRSGPPSAMDRINGLKAGVAAVDFIKKKYFGYMVAILNHKVKKVLLRKAVEKSNTVEKELYDLAKLFFM